MCFHHLQAASITDRTWNAVGTSSRGSQRAAPAVWPAAERRRWGAASARASRQEGASPTHPTPQVPIDLRTPCSVDASPLLTLLAAASLIDSFKLSRWTTRGRQWWRKQHSRPSSCSEQRFTRKAENAIDTKAIDTTARRGRQSECEGVKSPAIQSCAGPLASRARKAD